jgi:hypothetical protein
MTTALDLIEAEERRRDELVATVRHVVAQNYAAGVTPGSASAAPTSIPSWPRHWPSRCWAGN